MKSAYLLTGEPRVGKTTIIKEIVAAIGNEYCGGFYTEEIYGATKEGEDHRQGFRLLTLDGETGILAHVHSRSPLRLGRYGIDLACLESIGIAALLNAAATKKLVVIDELGPMQAYSAQFKHVLLEMLEITQPMLGTIALPPHPWLDTIKRHERVTLFEVKSDNKAQITDTVFAALKQQSIF
jgi:nucleoside-triphosphatase